MAFNPFTWFRKHQKVLFAGLTILCMVVFIGQFGAGDVFTRALSWFGAGRAGGETVTTLYGKKLRQGDLDRLQVHRKLASDFLFATAWEAHQKVCRDLLDGQLKSTEPGNPLSGLREIVQSAQQRAGIGLLMSRTPAQFLRIQIEQELNRLEEIAARDKVGNDPERLALVQRVATVLGFQFWLTGPSQIQGAVNYIQSMKRVYPRDWYFGGSDKVDDLLDFALWQRQADRLGIQLNDDAVRAEVVAEAAGAEVFEPKVPFDADRGVVEFLQTQPASLRLTPKDLMDALREEFRVVMAQAVLLGSEPGVRMYRLALGATSSPALATPDEFFDYFRQQRTTLRVKFLTVPVASYLDRVKDQPGEAELRTRFDRYKDQEPTAFSRDPGFKEPRRFVVEYVYASPKDAYYRDLGRAKLYAWAAATVGAASPLGALAQAAGDPLRQEYEQDQRAADAAWFYSPRDSALDLADRVKKLHYTSVMKPGPITALAGSVLTPAASPWVALSNLYGAATFEEVRTSATFTFTQLLAGSNPQALFGNAALAAAALPPQPSFELMRPQILATVLERTSEEELRKNMNKVREELAKFRGRANAGKEYVAKAAKEHHLKHHAMPEPMTQDAIVEAVKRKKKDVGLAPLRDALSKSERLDRVEQFVNWIANVSMGQQRSGTYDPIPFTSREGDRTEFVVWRSQDLPARSREFHQVRGEVLAAWKLEKARQLARDEAQKIEAEINKAKANAADAVRILNEQKQGEVFELDNIAQLVPPREVLAARRTEYSAYQVPDDKQALFEFPPPDLAKQLLALKRPGQATVIVDQPAKNFYVAVLLERSEPTMADFKAVYARTPKEDTMYTFFLAQRRADYRRQVLEQLRREAGEVDKDGKFKVPDSIRRGDSQPREEE
jgi:hypothetical protein